MPRKQSEVERSLQIKGFEKDGGDHHYFVYYAMAGKKTRVFTKTSHGAREIDDDLLAQMAKQCRLSNRDFGLLIDCPMDRPAYEKRLIESGAVESSPGL